MLKNIPVVTAIFLVSLVLTACTSTTVGEPRFDSVILNDNVATIRAVAHDADLILIAKVLTVSSFQPAPSGVIENRQSVNYEVVKLVRGAYTLSHIEVHHLVVESSRQYDPQGGLSRQLFVPGQSLIILVKRDQIFFEDNDENFSALPNSPNNVKALMYNM